MSDTADRAAHTHPADMPFPPSVVGWYAAIVLAVLYWVSILDRFIIALLVDPIKHDLGLTDLQFSILQGFAFSGTQVLFGLLFGALADRCNRRWLIFAGAAIWAVATAACGVARSFGQLLLARLGVGVGEASLVPGSSSMLADLHPRERQTRAMAVFTIGSTVGTGTAFLIGGLLIEFLTHIGRITMPVVGEIRAWQSAFLVVGLPGLLIALLIFTVPEPVRRGLRQSAANRLTWQNSYGGLIQFMRTHPRFFLYHYLGFMFGLLVVTGGVSWYPAHLSRSFGWSPAQIGVNLGLALAAAGVVGKLSCGYCVDLMFRRGVRDAQLRWYAVCLVAATPIGIIATTTSSPWLCVGGVALLVTLLQPLPAVAFTALNLVTPNELRGAGIAFFSATAGLVGAGAGTLLVAGASEHLFGGGASIGLGIAAVIAACCPLGALCLALGMRPMRAAVAAAEDAALARQPRPMSTVR
jgi:MFS family permease